MQTISSVGLHNVAAGGLHTLYTHWDSIIYTVALQQSSLVAPLLDLRICSRDNKKDNERKLKPNAK